MQLICFILNTPWNVLALLSALLSVPYKIEFRKKPVAVVIYVHSFFWYDWVPGHQGVRALTLGNVVQLGRQHLPSDLKHELVHVAQAQRQPFFHPFLYTVENIRHGYRGNKYEREAYQIAGNTFVEH